MSSHSPHRSRYIQGSPSPVKAQVLKPPRRSTTPREEPTMGYPRPINRIAPPFLTSFHTLEENFHMTDQLMAEIERADYAQLAHQPAPGTSGVAYAGGAQSGAVYIREAPSPHKDVLATKDRRPLLTTSNSPPQGHTHSQARGTSPDRLSPPYHTPQGSSGESQGVNDYVSVTHKRESFSSTRMPTPPNTARRASASGESRTTPPATNKLGAASQTPPLQAVKTRTPDKSLPVQEEPEDDVKDIAYDPPRDDDDDTLIETETGYMRPTDDRTRERDDAADPAGYTPRSPSVTLPETFPTRHYADRRLSNLTKHHRNGSTDQLGLLSVDAVVNAKPSQRLSEPTRAAEQPPQQQQQRPHPLQTQVQREDHYYDDPAAAYLQMYFQSTRPNAPIPPTPHSQTAAPSPSPFVSSIQPSPAPPVGSPYPYPFTHVHRHPYLNHGVPTAPSSNYDPNHIEEQLALQMQMYALNNNAAMSDATFSPSSTPFPGAGYNPWAFLQASRAFGGRRFDSMSLQSSPSHHPVSLPLPSRGRGLKRREKSIYLHTSASDMNKAVKPPLRVESTQPRDTSPEPYSSGEETAGEGFDVHEEPAWVNGEGEGDEEWVDEEGDKDELLDLEYHPTFLSNIDKRRRKWDVRWDALQHAFHALDCETDTTMVLLAAPSHTTTLHTLTSRSVRRDQLLKSPAMTQMRTAFKGIASRRRAMRSRTPTASLLHRLLRSSSGSSGGSGVGGDASDSEARESELTRALEAALGSLESLKVIYEGRVSRWEEEMARISDERERVELLLRQTIGVGLQPNGI